MVYICSSLLQLTVEYGIYLKLRKKFWFYKLSKFTKWLLVSHNMVLDLSFGLQTVIILWIFSAWDRSHNSTVNLKQTRTNVDHLRCDRCQASFAQKSGLNAHVKTCLKKHMALIHEKHLGLAMSDDEAAEDFCLS